MGKGDYISAFRARSRVREALSIANCQAIGSHRRQHHFCIRIPPCRSCIRPGQGTSPDRFCSSLSRIAAQHPSAIPVVCFVA